MKTVWTFTNQKELNKKEFPHITMELLSSWTHPDDKELVNSQFQQAIKSSCACAC